MSEGDAERGAQLAATLRADLGDEGHWSVFADWLESQGDTRGELIRLEQRGDAATDPPEAHRWRMRAHQLFARDHQAWLGPLATPGLQPVWTRGFASEALILRDHAELAAALLGERLGALTWKLSFDKIDDSALAEVAACLVDSGVEFVELVRALATRLQPLAAVAGLRELFVDRGRVADFEALAELPALERVAMRFVELELGRVVGGFASLRELELEGCSGPRSGPLSLDGLGRLAGLEVLSLSSARIIGRELVHVGALARLRRLDLSRLGPRMPALTPLLGLDALERLDIYETELGYSPDAGQVLAELQARGVEVVLDNPRTRALDELEPWELRAR